MLITDLIRNQAQETPNKKALQFESREVTYQDLQLLINQTAHSLLSIEQEMESQPIIALLLDNSIELLQVFLAASKIGWLSAVLDPKWSKKELEATLHEAQPLVFVVHARYRSLLQEIPSKTKILVVNDQDQEQEQVLENSSTHLLGEWIESFSSEEPSVSVQDTALFYMGYTSGTTGRPKGFMRHHQSWIDSFQVAQKHFQLHRNQHVFAPGPLMHSLYLYVAVQTLSTGGTFYFSKKFDPASTLILLKSFPITHLYVVPTMVEAMYRVYEQMLKDGDNDRSFLQPLSLEALITSGDKLSIESKKKISEMLPQIGLYEFYGASELSFISVLTPEDQMKKPGSVGKKVESIEISIRTADGQEVKPGEVGQLFVKSRMVFTGYFQNPEETKQVLHGEWATVGDLVYVDKEGFLYIVGRKKNMIISGGLNIFPEEVERVILQYPQIEEAIVLGLKDGYWGEQVIALVKCRGDSQPTEKEVISFCQEHLAHYKCPRQIRFVDSFPYTTSGKISRSQVIQMIQTLEDIK